MRVFWPEDKPLSSVHWTLQGCHVASSVVIESIASTSLASESIDTSGQGSKCRTDTMTGLLGGGCRPLGSWTASSTCKAQEPVLHEHFDLSCHGVSPALPFLPARIQLSGLELHEPVLQVLVYRPRQFSHPHQGIPGQGGGDFAACLRLLMHACHQNLAKDQYTHCQHLANLFTAPRASWAGQLTLQLGLWTPSTPLPPSHTPHHENVHELSTSISPSRPPSSPGTALVVPKAYGRACRALDRVVGVLLAVQLVLHWQPIRLAMQRYALACIGAAGYCTQWLMTAQPGGIKLHAELCMLLGSTTLVCLQTLVRVAVPIAAILTQGACGLLLASFLISGGLHDLTLPAVTDAPTAKPADQPCHGWLSWMTHPSAVQGNQTCRIGQAIDMLAGTSGACRCARTLLLATTTVVAAMHAACATLYRQQLRGLRATWRMMGSRYRISRAGRPSVLVTTYMEVAAWLRDTAAWAQQRRAYQLRTQSPPITACSVSTADVNFHHKDGRCLTSQADAPDPGQQDTEHPAHAVSSTISRIAVPSRAQQKQKGIASATPSANPPLAAGLSVFATAPHAADGELSSQPCTTNQGDNDHGRPQAAPSSAVQGTVQGQVAGLRTVESGLWGAQAKRPKDIVMEELFVGVLLFVPLFALLPTTLAFHLFASCAQMLVLVTCSLLRLMELIWQVNPLFLVMWSALWPDALPGSLILQEVGSGPGYPTATLKLNGAGQQAEVSRRLVDSKATSTQRRSTRFHASTQAQEIVSKINTNIPVSKRQGRSVSSMDAEAGGRVSGDAESYDLVAASGDANAVQADGLCVPMEVRVYRLGRKRLPVMQLFRLWVSCILSVLLGSYCEHDGALCAVLTWPRLVMQTLKDVVFGRPLYLNAWADVAGCV